MGRLGTGVGSQLAAACSVLQQLKELLNILLTPAMPGKAPPGPHAAMGPPSLAMSASSRMSFRQGAGPNSSDHMVPLGPDGLRRDSGMSDGFQSPLASSSHYYNAQSFR
jgi:hypothetical protein